MSKLPSQLQKETEVVNILNKETKKASVEKKFYNLEKKLENSKDLFCRISTKNKIKFCNTDFIKTSGYPENNLLNMDYDNLIHPLMPKVIKILIKHRLNNHKNISAITKNLDKDGLYFWTISDYKVNTLENNLNIAFSVRSKAISKETTQKIEKLYTTLLKIEENIGLVSASKYLLGFLEEKGMSFSNYMRQITNMQ